MIPVKIECGCGQHYAFEVEPENGRMASSVACPVCGADGTASANEMLAQSLAAQTAAVAPRAGGTSLRIAASENAGGPVARTATAIHKSAPHASQLGLVDRSQAEVEARAKISWGDPPEAVIKYLMLQGFNHQEASELVQVMFQERTATTRGNGVKKIVIGCGLVCVPLVAYLIFAHIGVIPIKLMGIAVAVGLWGVWLILNGIIMIVAPKLETGDVAEQ